MNYKELLELKNEPIAFDLDGTICDNMTIDFTKHTPEYMKEYYINVKPIPGMIKLLNKLAENNLCYIFTARDDIYQNETINWLKKHKVNYEYVVMKKPYFRVLIDDRVIDANELIKITKDF